MTRVIRVLYVDDEPDLLEISKLLLEESGDFSVATVGSAPAALELLNKEHFDAIISDYQMPGMDGIRLLVEVRKHLGKIPFILFTGKGREEIVIEALNNGADFYLQKGGEPGAQYAELSHKIRTAVGLHAVSNALVKSEEKYRRIVETANEGIWAMDRQFITTYVNERMAGILGYTVDEMIGNTIQTFIPAEELVEQQLKLEQRMNGQIGSYERRFRAKDGTSRTCHVSATPVKGEDGSFQGSFAMLTDITDRVLAEEEIRKKHEDLESSYEELTTTSEELCHTMDALAKKENLYRTLFREMLNGIAVHEIICDEGGTPRDYRFIDVNPAFERMTGLSRADIIGRTVLEVMPDTEPFWIEQYGQVALTGLPDHFDNYSKVLGKFFEVMVYQNAKAQFTTVIADVTDRRRAEKQLQESEAHLSEAQKLAKIGSWEYDSASGKISWTRQTFRIFERDPRKGEPSFEEMTALWHNEDLLAFTEAVRLAGESGIPFDLEQRIIPKSGKQKYIRAQGEAVWKNEVVIKLWGTVQDITERKRSEKALAESEEVFREVFNKANDAIFLHEMLPGGFPGQYFRVNDIACTLLGYSKEELLTMSPRDIASPGHRLNIPDIVTKIKSKGYATFEAIYQRKDGSFLPVEVSTHLFTLQGREVALSISRDITERKHGEEALGKSERKYRELIEYANEAILVAQDGTMKLVNARMAELTGYPEGELLSTPFSEFIHPDDRSSVVERYQKRLKGEDIPSRYMFRLTSKDGKIKWVEISSVAVDYEGRPATLNFLTNITERKQMEDALRESEEFNRELVENIPDMVAVYGRDRKVRYVNPAADSLLGYSENGRVGTDILSYVIPEKRSEIGIIIEERLKSGSTQSLEIEIMRNDGKRKTVITRSTPVQYHDEEAVLLLLTDISDRKALENQLVTRAEELTRLSLSLAMANKKLNLLGSLTRHDIINKLTLISGYTSQLKKRVPDPELAPYFAKQEDAVRRINEYLQFTKTYEAIGIHTPAWLNVKDMVQRGFAAIPHDGITLESDLDGITVYADPLFEKIFPNLLENSVRHGGHVTRVRVYAREADGVLTLFWEDNGTGVPAEEKERIFERGYGKNTGLGLFLATDILYITGITIRETGETGRGARFEIAIPKGMWRKE
jgi:PAS domain S-box-containing protein